MAFDSSTMNTYAAAAAADSPSAGGGGWGAGGAGTMAFGAPAYKPPLAPQSRSARVEGTPPAFATMSRVPALPPPIAMATTRALPPGPPPGAPPLESRISRMPETPMLVVRASQGVLVDESGAEISLLGLLSDTATSMPMLKALCAAALFDERTLLESVCRGLDPHNVLRAVLQTAIDTEMAAVSVGGNVFRDTASAASMLLCTYATLVAKAYIIDTARAFLDELARDRTVSDYNNLTNVERWSTSLLDTAAASLYDFPPTLAWLLNTIRTSSARRFASSPTVSVARFFFLRIICPALMVPVGAGVLSSEPTTAVSRAVRQVCKVMKALANAATFKNDVPMIPLNNYVLNTTARMAEICDMVSTDVPPLGATPPLASLADADAVHLKFVRDLMQRKLGQIEQSLNDVSLIRKLNAFLNA